MKYILAIMVLLPAICHAGDWSAAIGLQANSLNHKRGITTYKGYQVVPIYSLEKKGLPVMLAGSAIYYKNKFHKNFQFRSRLNFNSTGDRPTYYTETAEEDTIQRDSTSEWDFYLEHPADNHYLRLQYSKDLVAHKSGYAELHARYALLNFSPSQLKATLQASIYGSVGYGGAKHNQYFYGDSAEAGLSNYEVGLILASPNVIDPFWPTLKLGFFELLGDETRGAEFVEDRQGFSAQLLMAFKVF